MGDTGNGKAEAPPAPPAMVPPPPPPTPDEQVKAFALILRRLTPHAWVTWALIAANAIVYVVTIAGGADWMKPDVPSLIRFGGDYAPLTQGGQWWRLVTATFLHIGALHIALNMLVLAQIGSFVERLLGSTSFLALYLLCGIFGSLASVAVNPDVVSAGASGAVFGCYGIFVGFLLRSHGSIPPAVLNKLLGGAVVFIGYNVIYGLRPGIDMAGHIGGIVSGFLFGIAVAAPLTAEAIVRRRRRGLIVAAVGAAVAAAIAVALPKPIDVDAEIQTIAKLEDETYATLQRADADYAAKKLDEKGYAVLVRSEILPKWDALEKRLAALPRPKGRPGKVLAALDTYMKNREAAFEMYAEGADSGDRDKIDKAAQMTKDAQTRLQEMLK